MDETTRALRDAILDGRLPAGAPLRQTDLAARLGISRTPIREALGRLQQEGLVERLPRGGVRVALLDLEASAELYDLREVLDGLAARLAARRATAPALAGLERALDRMARSLAHGDLTLWFGAHVAFHSGIFRAAGNARLLGLLGTVRLSIRHFHPLLLQTSGRLARALEEHRRIYDAIAARDPEEAEREARAHIVHAREVVLKAMAGGVRDGAVQG